MYGGSGVSPAGSPCEAQAPASLAEMLEQLDVAVAPAGAQPPRRPRERLPETVAERLEQQHLAARALERQPRGQDARVVDDDELAAELLRQVGEDAMAHLVPPRGRRRAAATRRAATAGCWAISSAGRS